jgi:tripartite-type tricarboxylate transporter receptor subunit TctC
MNPIVKQLLAAGAALALATGPALAQTYPEKTVRMVVPFPPGSATDMAARVVAQQLQGALGQTFVVDNKPGAGGSIAGAEVVRAAPDGYTLLFSSNSAVASNVALLKSIPYDPMKDFTPVAGIGENMLVLMVKSSFPARNLAEFVAYAKARPGKLSAGYGSSTSQVSISLLNKLAGLDTLSVPYKGIPLAVNDVVGGTLDFTFVDLGNALAQAKGGNLKPIAVTSDKRNPLVPDWPAIQETYPGFDIRAWFAVVGPANLPKPVVDKLQAAIVKALAQPDTKERFATIGIAPMALSSEKLHTFMGAEIAKWQRLVKEANVQPE